MIFMTIGLMPGAVVATLPRHVYYAAQRILRPAESAVRHLIFMRAHGMIAPESKPRSDPPPSSKQKKPRTSTERTRAFRLIDPRKNFDDCYEPLHGGDGPHIPVPSLPEDDSIDTTQLFRRLDALQHALDDLPGRAMRMVRLMARRRKAPPGPGCVPPLRPGFPPGYRQRHVHLIDRILQDCHYFARDAHKYAPP